MVDAVVEASGWRSDGPAPGWRPPPSGGTASVADAPGVSPTPVAAVAVTRSVRPGSRSARCCAGCARRASTPTPAAADAPASPTGCVSRPRWARDSWHSDGRCTTSAWSRSARRRAARTSSSAGPRARPPSWSTATAAPEPAGSARSTRRQPVAARPDRAGPGRRGRRRGMAWPTPWSPAWRVTTSPTGGRVPSPRRSRRSGRARPGTAVEVLISDCKGDRRRCDLIFEARPDVLNHNIETVARLQRAVRPSAGLRPQPRRPRPGRRRRSRGQVGAHGRLGGRPRPRWSPPWPTSPRVGVCHRHRSASTCGRARSTSRSRAGGRPRSSTARRRRAPARSGARRGVAAHPLELSRASGGRRWRRWRSGCPRGRADSWAEFDQRREASVATSGAATCWVQRVPSQ